MRTKMSVVALVLAVTLGLSVATVGKAIADSCSGCGCCNAIYWDGATDPATVYADGDGHFTFSEVVNWTFDSPYTVGEVQLISVSGDNINWYDPDDPVATPSVFYPNAFCCTGCMTVQVTGKLLTSSSNGSIKSKAVVETLSSSKTVTINHS